MYADLLLFEKFKNKRIFAQEHSHQCLFNINLGLFAQIQKFAYNLCTNSYGDN